eukprot:scaffold73594_cov131-Cyclotella_meneghiniana.AAC.1
MGGRLQAWNSGGINSACRDKNIALQSGYVPASSLSSTVTRMTATDIIARGGVSSGLFRPDRQACLQWGFTQEPKSVVYSSIRCPKIHNNNRVRKVPA